MKSYIITGMLGMAIRRLQEFDQESAGVLVGSTGDLNQSLVTLQGSMFNSPVLGCWTWLTFCCSILQAVSSSLLSLLTAEDQVFSSEDFLVIHF